MPRNLQNPRTQSRKEAKAKGLLRYVSGIPCEFGNVAERLTSNGRCTCHEHQALRAKQHKKAYHRKNPAAIELGQSPRALAKAEGALRYQNGIPCKHGFVVDRLTSNGACLCKACEADRRRKIPADKKAERIKSWRQRNPEKVNELKSSRRRAESRVLWADKKAIQAVYREARMRSFLTGVRHHVDHEIPLHGTNVCGLHVPDNLRVVPWRENLCKGRSF